MRDNREAGWGERAVNKVVKLAIARLVKAEQIDIWVKTTLPQAMRGEVDAIAIDLQGLLVRENLRVENFQLQIGRVSVVPKLAIRGTIQLVQPAAAELTLTIRENQLSNFLEMQFAKARSPLLASSEDLFRDCLIDQIQATFLVENQLQIAVSWKPVSAELIQSSVLSTVPVITSEGQTVRLAVQSTTGQELPEEIITVILSSLEEVLSLYDFKQQGTSFQIQQLRTTTDEKLILNAAAIVHQFPS